MACSRTKFAFFILDFIKVRRTDMKQIVAFSKLFFVKKIGKFHGTNQIQKSTPRRTIGQ
jgi:hypothetical protein